jgi:uncharacterized protein (TIGR02147 family)
MTSKQSVFNFKSYKVFLSFQLHGEPSSRGSQTRLAKHLSCQSAYLYQVLNGKAELTEDQAYGVTTFFEMEPLESKYFLSLVSLSKAHTPDLRKYLQSYIAELAAEHSDLAASADAKSANLESAALDYYFSQSLPSLLHILTSSSQYQTEEALSRRLKVSRQLVARHLRKLSDFGFIEKTNERWNFKSTSLHFPEASAHNLSQHLIRRAQAMNSLLHREKEDSHFCSLFTLDPETYQKLKNILADFVSESQKMIHSGGPDEAYVLVTDLFKA